MWERSKFLFCFYFQTCQINIFNLICFQCFCIDISLYVYMIRYYLLDITCIYYYLSLFISIMWLIIWHQLNNKIKCAEVFNRLRHSIQDLLRNVWSYSLSVIYISWATSCIAINFSQVLPYCKFSSMCTCSMYIALIYNVPTLFYCLCLLFYIFQVTLQFVTHMIEQWKKPDWLEM